VGLTRRWWGHTHTHTHTCGTPVVLSYNVRRLYAPPHTHTHTHTHPTLRYTSNAPDACAGGERAGARGCVVARAGGWVCACGCVWGGA
jgi:hypothetical protein